MTIDRAALLEEVMWRGGIRERPYAEAAVAAVLDALAQQLSVQDRGFLAAQLPGSWAAALKEPTPAAAFTPGDLYAQLATSLAISVGAAIEHARASCSALAELFDGEARSLLARRLPGPWAALFAQATPAPEAQAPAGTAPGHGHTLATGRPGSRHPLADSAPPAAQPDSVVTAENPHGDSKLSSASEPAGSDRLATGRPGAEYPLARAKDERPGR